MPPVGGGVPEGSQISMIKKETAGTVAVVCGYKYSLKHMSLRFEATVSKIQIFRLSIDPERRPRSENRT